MGGESTLLKILKYVIKIDISIDSRNFVARSSDTTQRRPTIKNAFGHFRYVFRRGVAITRFYTSFSRSQEDDSLEKLPLKRPV